MCIRDSEELLRLLGEPFEGSRCVLVGTDTEGVLPLELEQGRRLAQQTNDGFAVHGRARRPRARSARVQTAGIGTAWLAPARARSPSALSIRSQVNSSSSRPKCP